MRRAPTTERQVARTVIAWLRLVLPPGAIVASVETEQRGAGATALERARYGMARKASGAVSGFPDAVAVMPGGRALWFEWKRPAGGVLSLTQQGMHQRFQTLGHPVIVANSLESARHGLRQLGVPLREDPAQLVIPSKVRKAKSCGAELDTPVRLP